MISLCDINILNVVRKTDFGVYLDEPADRKREMSGDKIQSGRQKAITDGVLLPGKECPPDVKEGMELEVFVYLDSKDRPIATRKKPYITKNSIGMLEVKDVNNIGAFLDWGLEKDLLLPFKEQLSPVSTSDLKSKIKPGDKIPVSLYIDKSGRPAATMRIYNLLTSGGDYVKDSGVSGRVIQINPDLGVFVAVDDKYFGMIPIREVVEPVNIGDMVYGRVSSVRPDGKYMISLSQKSYIQMDNDSQSIYQKLVDAGGELPFGDKSDPGTIKKEFGMTKNSFKRAVGKLYKEGKIIPEGTKIKVTKM